MKDQIKGLEVERRFRCKIPAITFSDFVGKVGVEYGVQVRVFLNPDFPEKVKVSIDGIGKSLVCILSEIEC